MTDKLCGDAHSELVAERMKTATELADKVLAGHVFDAAHEVYTACKTLALVLKIAIRAATPRNEMIVKVEGPNGTEVAAICALDGCALMDGRACVQNDTPANGAAMDIDKLVDRFLSWKLPRDFSPDGGISFVPSKTHPDMWPIGTNLFTADQAKEMLAHVTGPLRAKLDRLMIEYCPDEMTPEQMENWGKHQRPVTPEQEAAVQRAVQSETPASGMAKVPEGMVMVPRAEVEDLRMYWNGLLNESAMKDALENLDRVLMGWLAAAPTGNDQPAGAVDRTATRKEQGD